MKRFTYLFSLALLLACAVTVSAQTVGNSSVGSTSYPTTAVGCTTNYNHAGTPGVPGSCVWLKLNSVPVSTVTQLVAYLMNTGTLRMGLYTDASGYPGSLIYDSGELTASSTGWYTHTMLTPYHNSTAQALWVAVTYGNGNMEDNPASDPGTYFGKYYEGLSTSTALPSTAPAGMGGGGSGQWGSSEYANYIQVEGYVKGYRYQYTGTTGYYVTDFDFYVHSGATGNFRLALYSDNGSGAPTQLLWSSGSIAAVAGQNNSVGENAGTTANGWGGTLTNGSYYWLMWQWDNTSSGPSYTAGSGSNGIYLAQAYGAFPSSWSGGTFTSEQWTEYASYSPGAPSDHVLGLSSQGSTSYPSTSVGWTTQGNSQGALGNLVCLNVGTVPAACTVTQLVVYTYTSGTYRIGLYDDASGYPNNLLYDSGPLSSSGAGWQTHNMTTPYYNSSAQVLWVAVSYSANQEANPSSYGGPYYGKLYKTWNPSTALPNPGGSSGWGGGTSGQYPSSEYANYVQIMGYVKGYRYLYSGTTGDYATGFNLYVHSGATGNFRLAFYDDNSGSPNHLLWYSPSTAVTAGQNNFVGENSGTIANSWDGTLTNGSYYWLMWQWDNTSSGPSYVAGTSGSAVYKAQTYGSFPDPWSGGTSSAEQWTEYASYYSKITSAASGNWNTGGTWTGGSVPTQYNPIEIQSGNTVTLDVSPTVTGVTLTVDNGGALDAGTYNISGTGNFTLASAATLQTGNTSGVNGTIQTGGTNSFSTGANYMFNGSSAQVTGTNMPSTVNNLTISNSPGVSLSQSTTVNNTLTMTSGKLTTSGSDLLTLASGAGISGASGSSYVNGPLAWTCSGTGSKTFPIGSSTAYRPLTLNVTALTGSGIITAVQTDANPGSTSLPTGVHNISTVRYFTVTPAAGITALTAAVTLSWGGDDGVNNLAGMTVVHGTHGGAWDIANNSGGTTGDASSGTVTGNGFTSFSDFTLGSTTSDNSLPVQATAFKAAADVGSVTITWETKSEVNNAGFNVLRQDPGTSAFKLVGSYTTDDSLKGLGTTSTGRIYTFVDNRVVSGAVYQYKVQSVSTGGDVEDLNTLSVTVSVPKDFALYQNYPNPFNPSTIITYDLPTKSVVTITIYDVLGRQVETLVNQEQNAGEYKFMFNGDKYASGIYLCKMVAGNYSTVKKMILAK